MPNTRGRGSLWMAVQYHRQGQQQWRCREGSNNHNSGVVVDLTRLWSNRRGINVKIFASNTWLQHEAERAWCFAMFELAYSY